jgi:TonB family protein
MRSPWSSSNPRARRRPAGHPTRHAAYRVAVCAWCVLAALTASEIRAASSPIDLDAKVATKLLEKEDPPDYPPLARLNYIQGKVRVNVLVGPDGKVTEAHVVRGHALLAAAALRAVRDWVYRPYRVGKKTVAFWTPIDFRFALRSKTLREMPLTPEKDLRARVTPPAVLQQPADPPSDAHVRIRVLVGAEGRALDEQFLCGDVSQAREAEEEVSHWKFRPARWGALAVPWYLVVDVPVHRSQSEDPAPPTRCRRQRVLSA